MSWLASPNNGFKGVGPSSVERAELPQPTPDAYVEEL